MGDNDTLKTQYSRAIKQIIDTVAPQMNPKRRAARIADQESAADGMDHSNPEHRQRSDRNND